MESINLKITKQDKALLDNLIKMLGRAKLELEGVEIIVAADSMRWLSRLQKQIEDLQKAPPIEFLEDKKILSTPTDSSFKKKRGGK